MSPESGLILCLIAALLGLLAGHCWRADRDGRLIDDLNAELTEQDELIEELKHKIQALSYGSDEAYRLLLKTAVKLTEERRAHSATFRALMQKAAA